MSEESSAQKEREKKNHPLGHHHLTLLILICNTVVMKYRNNSLKSWVDFLVWFFGVVFVCSF